MNGIERTVDLLRLRRASLLAHLAREFMIVGEGLAVVVVVVRSSLYSGKGQRKPQTWTTTENEEKGEELMKTRTHHCEVLWVCEVGGKSVKSGRVCV